MPAVKHNKQNVSVTLDPILVKQAREIGINLSQTLTSSSKKRNPQHRNGTAGKKENARAIDYLNDLTEENGLLSDEYRTF